MIKKLLLLICSTILVGCVSLPSEQEIASADYGQFPNNHEAIVKDYYATALKDPDSVKYRSISSPRKTWLGDRINGAQFGYLVCVTYNAKNSFGAYVGYGTDGLLIRNGSVIIAVPKGDWWGRNICR